MFKKKADGTYSYGGRFWIYITIATVLIVYIGWRTQQTANKVEDTATDTRSYAISTNECLNQVITVLTTRVGYNEAIDALDIRRRELDARRQGVWEKLVNDLTTADNSAGLSQDALKTFMTANNALKVDQALVTADQAKLTAARSKNQYPDCVLALPGTGR